MTYGISGNFHVVPNVDTNLCIPQEKVSQKSNHPKILSACLLSSVKGLQNLLNAIAKLINHRHDFVLDIEGDGPELRELELLTKTLELEGVNFSRL